MVEKNISEDVDKLKEDLKSLRQDLSQLVDTLREAGIAEGKAARDRTREYSQQARDRVRERVGTAEEALEKEILERPIASALKSFGIGFIIGMILDRRH